MARKTFIDRNLNPIRLSETEDDLRELLSYCRSMECADDPGYGDVANRLTKILDGEQ